VIVVSSARCCAVGGRVHVVHISISVRGFHLSIHPRGCFVGSTSTSHTRYLGHEKRQG